jgi:hypothetical protein
VAAGALLLVAGVGLVIVALLRSVASLLEAEEDEDFDDDDENNNNARTESANRSNRQGC